MAPILKEAETTVANNTAPSPASPAPKPAAEVPARPQPVALEIPVTINGARTVEGSDKREPFSETTQTVLVFAHGAVVRVATPLAAGQLVFLTNEKTKKEVVSQVVKSKSSGSAGNYVELKFTEPAPGFWGFRMPSSPVAPAPAPPSPAKPAAVAPKPTAPHATAPPPAPLKPAVELPPVTIPQPALSQSIASAIPAPPPPVATVPDSKPEHAAPPAPVPPESSEVLPPTSTLPDIAHADPSVTPQTHIPAIPPPPLRDYSKEIDALFSVPHSSTAHPAPTTTPDSKLVPASSSPSSEELKLQAARLQAQLNSLLFTESPASTSSAPVSSASQKVKADLPSSDVAKKILEIAHEEPKPVVVTELKPALPVRKPTSSSFSAEDEEVKIPAWLAPLSRNSEPSAAQTLDSGSVDAASIPEITAIPDESSQVFDTESSIRSQAAVFGGQLLGESSPESAQSSSSGSRKGLFFALAAAVVLIAGGGVWYFRASLFGSSTSATVKAVSPAAPGVSLNALNLSVTNKISTPSPSAVNPAPVSSPLPSQPVKNPMTVSSPAVSTAASESRKSNQASTDAAEAEPSKQSPLGEVHLAAPVVSHSSDSQQEGEALPSIDTNAPDSNADVLADVATSHRKAPIAPPPVGGEVTPAQLIKSVPPVYPTLAKSQRISGNVQIDALVDSSGNVAEVKVISGPPLLHRAALDAVKEWKYKPAVLDGQPTSTHLTVTVEFRSQ